MKAFLPALLLLLLAAATAHATSKFAGKYYGLSYADGNIVAGVNITVANDGTISGQGAYVDLTGITITGKVNAAGKVKIKQFSNGDRLKYTARLDSAGQTFTAILSTGNVFKGAKVSSSFPQAGIYYAEDDMDEEGVFILENDRVLSGIIYDDDDDLFTVGGTASSKGFSGEDSAGVTFTGGFDGTDISGSYSYEGEVLGTFDGYRY